MIKLHIVFHVQGVVIAPKKKAQELMRLKHGIGGLTMAEYFDREAAIAIIEEKHLMMAIAMRVLI